MNKVLIKLQREDELARFLESNGFTVEELANDVFRVQREEELPVYLKVDEKQIYFEVDLGNIEAIISQDLLLSLLALNTEILPVSAGLDTSNPDDRRLVLWKAARPVTSTTRNCSPFSTRSNSPWTTSPNSSPLPSKPNHFPT